MNLSLLSGPLGNLGSPLTGYLRDSWRAPEREHLFLRKLLGGSFLGIWMDMERRAQGTDITLHGGPAGEFCRALTYWGLVKALEIGTFLHKGPVKYHGGSIHHELLRDS
jgi:hypothetical protein